MASSLSNWFAGACRMLRLTPFDTATEDGRSRERYRRIAWTSVSAATAKGSAMLAMLVSVPITLSYLGPERFGLWMVVTATVAMLHFADFGLSNGLLTAIAQAKGKDDVDTMQKVVANGLLMLVTMGLAIGLLFLAVHSLVRWERVFNVESPLAVSDSGTLVLVLVVCFIANLPVAVTQKIQLGLQRGYLGNAWETLGSLFGLAGAILAVKLEASLPWIALSMAGTPVLARTMNSLVFFGIQMPNLRPGPRHIDAGTIARLFRVGGLYFILQLAMIVGFQSDNIIIAHLLGAEAVAGYDIAFKLAMLPSMLISFVVIAQWPAYAEAAGRGDQQWIRNTFTRTLRNSLALGVVGASLYMIVGQEFIRIWAGPDVVPDRRLLVCLAIWSVLSVAGGAIAALLNGLHIIAFQAVNSTLMAIANVILSILLVPRVGPVGAALGSIVAYMVFTLVPCWVYIGRLFSRGALGDPTPATVSSVVAGSPGASGGEPG